MPAAVADSLAIPELAFSVLDAGPLEHAATPTLRFTVRIESAAAIRSILLHTQVQIAARRRPYAGASAERLLELFGEPARWGTTLRTLLWTQHTQVVPPFSGSTEVDVPVACTYDFDVVATRYLAALDEGEVPLELLFGGTVFYSAADGRLQTAQIAWDREAGYRMPVSVWKDTMKRHFADSAWLRLSTASLERLQAYKSRHALASFDAAIERLLA